MGLVYKITNKVNGKLYVGKTEKSLAERVSVHLKHVKKGVNRPLYDSIRHHGWGSFLAEVIEANIPKDNLNTRERYWIAALQAQDRTKGYNLTEGGDGGAMPPDVLARIGAKKRGSHHSEETKRQMSETHRGVPHPHSRESNLKTSATLKRKYQEGTFTPKIPPVRRGTDHPMYGRTHTKEVKERLSLARRGRSMADVIGTERAAVLAQKRREGFTGKNNPLYRDIPRDDLLKHILDGMTNLELARMYGVSDVTIWNKTRTYFGMTATQIRQQGYPGVTTA